MPAYGKRVFDQKNAYILINLTLKYVSYIRIKSEIISDLFYNNLFIGKLLLFYSFNWKVLLFLYSLLLCNLLRWILM